MGIGRDGTVRRQLRTLFNVGAVRELTDGQLLERFATERGEAAELAFAVLVERHGPMVMRVCRGVLADADAAQDAFQATFLVLVKRGRGLWVRDSIGPWLHQVAYRTARCARATAARRRRLERRAALSEEDVRPERDFELERLLHEEIDRLPERYRAPVVLCDLEGRTYEQAARHLGWPVGSVKSRLSRGRERLRARLIGRGVGGALGPLAVVGAFKAPALSIPPALLDATTAAAVRFAVMGTAFRGSAVTLAEGVLRTMTMTQWWKVVTVLVVAGATASAVEWIGPGDGPGAQVPAASPKAANAGEGPTREVKRGRLEFARSSRGVVEALRAPEVYCNVEGQTTIISIKPEGMRVKKGDLIAVLDSAALKDQLINQRIRTKSAEANYLNARLTREVAEIAVKEFVEGIYKQDRETMERDIEWHRNRLRKIEERRDRTRKALKRLGVAMGRGGKAESPAEIIAQVDIQDRIDEAEIGLDRERRDLAQAEGRREVLEKYTRPKTVKELESEVKKSHSDELAKQATWELEKSKEDKLETQIAFCTLTAPIDGVVIYPYDPIAVGRGGSRIEEGTTVRERQIIAKVLDDKGPMQINLKVPEAWVDQMVPNLKARVMVDAYPDRPLTGQVMEVARLPDPPNAFNPNIKLYSTRIRLDGINPGLRPGMTASADVVIAHREDSIGVPIGAVVTYDDKPHVALEMPEGGVEWRDVVVGVAGDTTVEIKEGLRSGERVIIDPNPFLSDEQKARIQTAKPARRPIRKKAATGKGQGTATPKG